MPRWPDYGEKRLPIPFTFTAQCLGKVGGYRFVAADNKHVYLDFDKTVMLLPWVLKSLADFPLDDTLAAMRQSAHLPDTAKLCEVRLIPLPGFAVELEAIFSVPMPLLADSLAEKLYGQLAEGLDHSLINDALLALLRDTPAAELPRIAAIDPGLNNFLTLAYSFHQRAMVLTNRAIENELARFDKRCDHRLSELMTPELEAMQARLAASALAPDELIPFKRRMKAIHADEQLRELRRDRANWQNDMLHKVSAGIVDYLVRYQVQVLVIGRNRFWKHAIHMGRKMNRRSLRTAHTRLIELLKYKCLAAGILVVTTEESYTSKTSFALDEELQVYDSTKALSEAFEMDKAKEADAGKPQASPSVQEPTTGGTPPAPTGKVALRGWRGRGDKRNFFTSPGAPSGWEVIHADVNGAFNIIRKVFRHFRYHAALTPKFLLFRFDQTANLTRMRLSKAA